MVKLPRKKKENMALRVDFPQVEKINICSLKKKKYEVTKMMFKIFRQVRGKKNVNLHGEAGLMTSYHFNFLACFFLQILTTCGKISAHFKHSSKEVSHIFSLIFGVNILR